MSKSCILHTVFVMLRLASKHVIFGSSLVSKSMKVMTNTKELLFRVASETGLLRRNQFRWSL